MPAHRPYTQNEHYVPQFYLKYFANKSGLVLVTDKINRSTFESSPRSICAIKDLYEIKKSKNEYAERNTVEKALSCYEGFLKEKLSKLIYRCEYEKSPFVITGEEDAALAFFIALQLVRQPETKKYLNDVYNRGITKCLGQIDREVLYLINALHNKQGYVHSLIAKLDGMLHPYTIALIQENQTIFERITSHILSNCYFSVMIPKSKALFYKTCDNPIIKNTPFIDALYFFSLSPRHLIIVSNFETLDKKYAQNKLWAEDETVNRINELIYENATRFIFATGS